MTHTTGPWAIGCGGEVYSKPRHQSVCIVLLQGDEGDANAALISKAYLIPEMEAALSEVNVGLDAAYSGVRTLPAEHPARQAVERATTILAKLREAGS